VKASAAGPSRAWEGDGRMRRGLFTPIVVAVAVATLASLGMVALGRPALATFPGRNGRIAFSTGGDGTDPSLTGQIFTVRPDGTGLRQVTHVAKGQHAVSPSFSPDGKKILFQSDVTGSQQIWVMNADGSGKTQLTKSSTDVNIHATWSPDGTRIVFGHCSPQPFGLLDCRIAVMAATGGAITTLTTGHWMDNDPQFSPDGTKIAFDSNRGGLQSAVWVIDANGAGLTRLTAPKLEAFWPDWSPDGTHIVFTIRCCVAGSNVWVMSATGARPHALTHVDFPHNAGFASYSPDGKKIVLQSDLLLPPDTCCGFVYVMNADGSNPHTIETTKSTVLFSDWGPAH
jgi:TolB protein